MSFRFEPVTDFIDPFEKLTRKDRTLRERVIKKIDQILANPEIGEPKRYRLKRATELHERSTRFLLDTNVFIAAEKIFRCSNPFQKENFHFQFRFSDVDIQDRP